MARLLAWCSNLYVVYYRGVRAVNGCEIGTRARSEKSKPKGVIGDETQNLS